ncbi:MAG: Holliday junction resolvase RuvX [Dehalococcoidia bacterium]|nr:Holliday junction resolvase RuvX [Dehalococcoidia bacterium]
MRLLGVDAGTRRTGVAVSHGGVAVPLTIIEHERRSDAVARVIAIAVEQEVEAIIVGLPLGVNDEEGAQARRIRAFGDAVVEALRRAGRAEIPVVYEDERLSTAEVPSAAGRRSRARNARTVHPAGRRGVRRVDDLAAAVILQRYLDARPASETGADEAGR